MLIPELQYNALGREFWDKKILWEVGRRERNAERRGGREEELEHVEWDTKLEMRSHVRPHVRPWIDVFTLILVQRLGKGNYNLMFAPFT